MNMKAFGVASAEVARVAQDAIRLTRRMAYYLTSIFTLLRGVRNWTVLVPIFSGLGGRRTRLLRLRHPALVIAVQNAMEAWIVKETCLDRCYERMGTPILDGWCIVDLGAAVGDFALLAAHCAPHGVIHAYEPQPDLFTRLAANLRHNAAAQVNAFAEAVGARTGPMTVMTGATWAPQLRASAADMHTATALTVAGVTLADVVARLPGGVCDLLKIDCEGAEYEILPAAAPALWPRIRRIVMEYHDGIAGHAHGELVTLLEQQGYRAHCHPSPVRRKIGFLYFTRSDERPEAC
jgi:FkbM family methyltransferase